MHVEYERPGKGRGVQVKYITFEIWIDKDETLQKIINNNLLDSVQKDVS